jgi:hypothetical protein
MMRYLIGADDTDNAKSAGTAARMSRLAEWLHADRLAEPLGVTRHQLYAGKGISYTGHNTCACLALEAENVEAVWETARDFLSLESERKSNAGLSLGRWDGIGREVVELGRRAKTDVVTLEDVQAVAARSRLRLAAVHGDGSGMIGALAAVGLHRDGNDGRFAWLPGQLDLQGKYRISEILDKSHIDRVCLLDGREPPLDALVDVGEGLRPILRDGQATLLVEEKKHGWVVLDKEQVKGLSS